MTFGLTIQTYDGAHAPHNISLSNAPIDYRAGRLWPSDGTNMTVYNYYTGAELNHALISTVPSGNGGGMGHDGSGNIYMSVSDSLNHGGLAQIDALTLAYKSTIDYISPYFSGQAIINCPGHLTMVASNFGNTVIGSLNNTSITNNSVGYLGSYGWPNGNARQVISPGRDGSGMAFQLLGPGDSGSTQILTLKRVDYLGVVTDLKTYVPTDFDAGWSHAYQTGMCVDQKDGYLIVWMLGDASPSNYLVKLRSDNGNIVWKTAINNAYGQTIGGSMWAQSRIEHSQLAVITHSDEFNARNFIRVFNTSTGAQISTQDTGMTGCDWTGNQAYNDTLGGVTILGSWDGSAGGPTPLNGSTPPFSDGWATVYVTPPFPAPTRPRRWGIFGGPVANKNKPPHPHPHPPVPTPPSGITQSPSSISILASTPGNTELATLTEQGGTGVGVIFSLFGNSNLTVSGNKVKTSGSPVLTPGVNQNYKLSVTDSGGTYNDTSNRTLVVQPLAPTGITQSPASITCLSTQAGNAILATLTEVGGSGVSVVFSVTGNSNLTVSGNQLRTVASPTFVAGVNETYSLHVTDTGGTYNDSSPRTITVPSVPSHINFSGTTIQDTAPAGTVLGTLSTTGGVAPYTYTVSNTKFTISGNQVLRSGTGTLTSGSPESLNFTSTDSNSTSTNTATNGQGPFSVSVTSAGSALVQVSFNNVSGTSYATPTVSFFQPFKDGDIPVNGSVTATDSLGNPVTVQMDQTALWPSGRMSGAVITLPLSETYGAGVSKTYTLTSSSSPPVTTLPGGWGGDPNAHAPDIRVQYAGGDAGSNTYTAKLQTILGTYSNYPWGTSFPKGGWRLTKAGPNCVEWHAWQYLINDSTGFPQGYVRCDMWVKALSPTGPYEVDVKTSMPNVWNTISTNSEMYNQYPNRFAANVTILNASTPVAYYGGSNDVRATTAVFNNGTQQVTLASSGTLGQTGVIFSTGGSLPTGILSNTIYWPSNGKLFTQRLFACNNDNGFTYPAFTPGGAYGPQSYCTNTGTGQSYFTFNGGTAGSTSPTGATFTDGTVTWERISPVFTDNGSGTITASPIYACFQNGGWAAADLNGDPIWVGSGTKPRVYPGHNTTYLFSSKAMPPYNTGASSAITDSTPPQYGPTTIPGTSLWLYQDTTGDGPGDQRIGHVDNYGLVSLYSPTDVYYINASLQSALVWNQYGTNSLYDERNGLPFAPDNGPNNNGTPYTNYPTPMANWIPSNVPGGSGRSPSTPGNSWVRWATTSAGINGGLGGQYWSDNSHTPCPMQVPYLKTGRTIFEDLMVSYAQSSAYLGYGTYINYNGTTSYNAINSNSSQQMRAWAWSLRNLCQGLYYCSNSHPAKQVLQAAYKSHFAYQAWRYSNMPSQAGILGVIDCNVNQDGNYAPWQYHFLDIQIALEQWRGGLVAGTGSNVSTVFNYMSNHYQTYSAGTDIYYSGLYYMRYSSVPLDFTTCYTSGAAAIAATLPQGNVANQPAPSGGINDGNNNNPPYFLANPQFVTAYGFITQTAMKTRSAAGDSTVNGFLSTVTSDISGQTGVTSAQGGALWTFVNHDSNKIVNVHCFTAW